MGQRAPCCHCSETRLVTLTGAGGVGKTRLAVEDRHGLPGRLPRWCVVVSLAPVDDAALAAATLAATLACAKSQGVRLVQTLIDYLRNTASIAGAGQLRADPGSRTSGG
jgi:predicted ATPase